MKDRDVKKVAQLFQQIPPADSSTTRDINSSTPLFIEPQMSRHVDLGCFIGHLLNQNYITCCQNTCHVPIITLIPLNK